MKGLEGEYQKAVNRMGRTTLGAFQSTPLGITAESGLTPDRALLNHRQARFTQRRYARPGDGGGPGEIPTGERSALTERLRPAAASALHCCLPTGGWLQRIAPASNHIVDAGSLNNPGDIVGEGDALAVLHLVLYCSMDHTAMYSAKRTGEMGEAWGRPVMLTSSGHPHSW